MLASGMTRLADMPDRTHDTTVAAKSSDGLPADVNPLIRQLLLAREALKESPQWQHAKRPSTSEAIA